jgi:hypothetical protein
LHIMDIANSKKSNKIPSSITMIVSKLHAFHKRNDII